MPRKRSGDFRMLRPVRKKNCAEKNCSGELHSCVCSGVCARALRRAPLCLRARRCLEGSCVACKTAPRACCRMRSPRILGMPLLHFDMIVTCGWGTNQAGGWGGRLVECWACMIGFMPTRVRRSEEFIHHKNCGEEKEKEDFATDLV